MSAKAESILRMACTNVRKAKIGLIRGPWFVWENGRIVACDAVGAVILAKGRRPEKLNSRDLEVLSQPGLVGIACELLDVNLGWLHRFWMGWDQGYQMLIEYREGDKVKYSHDSVSELGIRLRKEFLPNG